MIKVGVFGGLIIQLLQGQTKEKVKDQNSVQNDPKVSM